MKIEWLGHACFRVESENGTFVVLDPYKSGCFDNALRYGPIEMSADIVTASHDHDDHFDPGAVAGHPRIFKESGSFEHKGVRIRGVDTHHDPSGGSERGPNIVFILEIDGISLVHLGDLGHVLTPGQAESIGKADVVLVPVGGHFTIDKDQAREVVRMLDAKVAVPMHFKTAKVDFPISGVEGFLKKEANVKRAGSSTVEVRKGGLPESLEVWVLEPSR